MPSSRTYNQRLMKFVQSWQVTVRVWHNCVLPIDDGPVNSVTLPVHMPPPSNQSNAGKPVAILISSRSCKSISLAGKNPWCGSSSLARWIISSAFCAEKPFNLSSSRDGASATDLRVVYPLSFSTWMSVARTGETWWLVEKLTWFKRMSLKRLNYSN